MNEVYNNIATNNLNISNQLSSIQEKLYYHLTNQTYTKEEVKNLINELYNIRIMVMNNNQDIIKNFYPSELKEDYLQTTNDLITNINNQNQTINNMLDNQQNEETIYDGESLKGPY